MRRVATYLAIALVAGVWGVSLAAQTIAITGGKVFPVSGSPIQAATVLMRDGKIVAVGTDVSIPAGTERVDATGKWVTPGLIDAATQLGLVEIGQVADTREASARGRNSYGINAAFTVWEGLNPASVLLAPARQEGVTSVAVAPQGGLISGQAAVIDLVDGSVSDLLVKSPVGMVGEIGSAADAGVASRGELIVRMHELLDDARSFMRHRTEFERNATRSYAASRIDLQAMIPVLDGRLPLFASVDKASDIEAALKLAQQYGIRLVVTGGAEAWMVAGKLKAAGVPVLTGAMNNIPTTFATLAQRQENAALLRKAGVEVALIGNAGGGDEEAFNVRNIRQEAGNAVAYGLSWDDALRALTLAPAQIFGVADRIGSLRVGTEANVVVWSGDPFEFGTRAEQVFIRGKRMTGKTRQDLLVDRYRKLPPSFQKP